ncbi:MAG: hypothetical protein EAZ89_01290 [Bacteroidetes bacterium]|nr:MAG: hypothetical protein EAZ89_01290 [Bacteroidota bacterium]
MPEVLPLAAAPEAEPAGSQWSMGVFSLAILSLIIIFWIGSSQRPVAPEFSCPFEADSLYHVLMLPPAAQDSQLRLRADSFFWAYPGKYRFQLVEKLPRDGVSRLFAGCHTDLVLEARSDSAAGHVLWTMYYESGPGAVQQGKVTFPQQDSSYTFAEVSSFLENMVFRARAMSAFGQENYAEALYWFRNLPERIFSQEPALLQRLAQSCVQVKEDDEARQHYDRLLLIDTANAAAYHERGGVLVRKRDYTAAREDFRRAVSLDSTLYDAWYNLGLLLINTESYEEAEPVARRLLRLKPEEARSQALMAATCAGMQDRDCLMSYLREARKLGLDVEAFLTYVPVFQSYRSDPEIKALLQ